jgi:hypothetical protein
MIMQKIRLLQLMAILAMASVHGASAVEEYILFDQGKTDYRIVLGSDASDSEFWAAQELRHWLKEISGADFPIVDDCATPTEREIILGINRHTRELLKEDTPEIAADDQGFSIKTQGPAILIYGGSQIGTQYGVMDFLETYLGCRWYTPAVSVIPQKDRFAFTKLERRDYPRLRVRNDFYFEAFDPIWAARNRSNGVMSYREQPGGVEGYWSVHTFNYFLPPEEFFADHPEYYSLIDGKRSVDHAQLCLTNPDVLNIMRERVKNFIRENPQYLIYSVSQNDWYGACQCENCQAIVQEEGSESGPMVHFVNQVAESIADEFPDKYIGTLAYQYTRKPPKNIKPRENVVIRLCSIECCFSHSFFECPENVAFLEDLRQWAKIAPQLYIWDYVVNFRHYILPHPNFNVLQANLQAFQQNKTIGVMEQACYNTRGGEFSELRAYLLAKLMWNPYRDDVNELIDDFMYGYYGRSGQHIRRYFDALHALMTPETHLHIFDYFDRPYFTPEFMQEANRLFDQAEAVAETPEILRRVEMARLPIMQYHILKNREASLEDGTYQRFKAICEREGISRVSEPQTTEEFWKSVEN